MCRELCVKFETGNGAQGRKVNEGTGEGRKMRRRGEGVRRRGEEDKEERGMGRRVGTNIPCTCERVSCYPIGL